MDHVLPAALLLNGSSDTENTATIQRKQCRAGRAGAGGVGVAWGGGGGGRVHLGWWGVGREVGGVLA